MDNVAYKIIGGVIMLFGLIDMVGYYLLNMDLTWQWWTPFAAFIIGGFIWGLGDKK